MFSQFSDLSPDDLAQQNALNALLAQPTFNPDKATASTFMWGVMSRRLIDLWRRRSCEAGHIAELGAYAAAPLPDTDDHWPEPDELAEWCRNNYANAKRTFGPKLHRIGREFHSVAQLSAVVLLMNSLALTPAEMVQFLREEPMVARALRFRHVPGENYF